MEHTALLLDPVPDRWPMEHDDVVHSVIDHPVPSDRAYQPAQSDGSVIVDRTRVELSARCRDHSRKAA